MRPRPLRLILAAGAAAALTAGTGVLSAGAVETTDVFTYTGVAQTFTVPDGVCLVAVEVLGGAGGAGETIEEENGAIEPLQEVTVTPGGLGGQATGTLAVTPGETLEIVVGGAGGTGVTDVVAGLGGFPNGGDGAFFGDDGDGAGGGGGGSSSISRAGEALAIAGGGGGAGGYRGAGAGGHGGGPGTDGGDAVDSLATGGASGGNGGTGGLPDGLGDPGEDGTPLGVGGGGGDGLDGGGGGGGGFHGGGGGGGYGFDQEGGGGGGGGGGGSGFGGATITQTDGVNPGDGLVQITYDPDADTCGEGTAPAEVVRAAPRFTG